MGILNIEEKGGWFTDLNSNYMLVLVILFITSQSLCNFSFALKVFIVFYTVQLFKNVVSSHKRE